MPVRIWRHATHMVKSNITIEKFLEDTEANFGEVVNLKAIQTTSMNVPSSVGFDKTKERICFSSIIAVIYKKL